MMTEFDDPEMKTVPVAPVTISIVGTGTGDGGGSAPTPSGTLAVTPGQQPNLIVNVVSPLIAIIVRFVNLFLTTFVGLVVAGLTPDGGRLLYTTDFMHLLVTCASLSLPSAGVGFIKDLVTVFGRLEGKYPLATGSI